jgi:hypothetical protein
MTLVPRPRLSWPEELDAEAVLTECAVGSRYPGLGGQGRCPGPGGEMTDEEYCQATMIAMCVLAWAEDMVRRPPGDEACDPHPRYNLFLERGEASEA